MLVYEYEFSDESISSITVDLIDASYILEWKQVLKNITKNIRISWHTIRCAADDYHDALHPAYDFLKNLKEAYVYLSNSGFEHLHDEVIIIDEFLKNPRNITQEWLNRWHRHFTSFETRFSRDIDYLSSTEETREFYKKYHDINKYVHALENYTYHKLPRRQRYTNHYQYAVQFTNSLKNSTIEQNYNAWHYIKPLYNNIFDIFKNDYDYDVWLNEDIVGKDQMKAWLDHDDLSCFDITGNTYLTPSVMFDPNKLYKKIFDDLEFRNESKRSLKAVDRLPLGSIIDPKSIDWNKIYTDGKLKTISLDCEVVWKSD